MSKVTVVFPAGRRTLPVAAAMLAENAELLGGLDRHSVHLVVCYDLSYQRTTPGDFRLTSVATERFASVTYLNADENLSLDWLRGAADLSEAEYRVLFARRAYASQKNIGFVYGLLSGADCVVFLDDDEYPLAPARTPSGIAWIPQDVVDAHVKGQSQADITNGLHSGYFSPIPQDLDDYLDQAFLGSLGRLLSNGSEFITETTFARGGPSFRYVDTSAPGCAAQTCCRDGRVLLTGSNIGFSVRAVRGGKTPPYYTPAGARGEDAIMGALLEDVCVAEVPVYTLHDPFGVFVALAHGMFPECIPTVRLTQASSRFLAAFLGWLAYAPLYMKMTSRSGRQFRERVRQMRRGLPSACDRLATHLGPAFSRGVTVFARYLASLDRDNAELMTALLAWQKVVRAI